MRAHRLVMVSVVLAMVAGCSGARTSAPAPRVAADSTPASLMDRSERSWSSRAAPTTKKKVWRWRPSKGIGATGGPAGREDLRPGANP